MIDQLQEQIKVVAEAREIARVESAKRIEALTAWQEENKALYTNESVTKGCCELEETKLRDLTLQAYAETGNKAPAKGVSVKIFEVLNYNPDEAKGWAIEHRVALKLDTATFGKIARVDKPSFVTISEEPRAQIAQHLEVHNA